MPDAEQRMRAADEDQFRRGAGCAISSGPRLNSAAIANTIAKGGSIRAAFGGRPEQHRGFLPRIVEEHLEIAPDALDADVQRVDRFEGGGEREQRKEGRDRRRRRGHQWRRSAPPMPDADDEHPHAGGAALRVSCRAELGIGFAQVRS